MQIIIQLGNGQLTNIRTNAIKLNEKVNFIFAQKRVHKNAPLILIKTEALQMAAERIANAFLLCLGISNKINRHFPSHAPAFSIFISSN